MKRLLLATLLIAVLQFDAAAQSSFFNTKDAYLGQKVPSDTPRIFADKMLVPDSGISMERCAFTSDGKEFYYVNGQTWGDSRRSRIRYFKFDGKKWQGPFTLLQGYFAPTLSIDGQTMYVAGGPGDGKNFIIREIHRKGAGWTEPKVYLKAGFGLYDYMPTRSGTAYVGSNARQGSLENFDTYDFCALKIKGMDTLVKSLGKEINTPGFDGDFYMAPDERYMIVSYKEKPDYECELGISFRRKDGTWPAPLNLGPLINDGDAHRWGQYVSPDGKYLFYTKGKNEKDCHIYWVRFDTLKKRLQHVDQAQRK
jgi:hypothetical protein